MDGEISNETNMADDFARYKALEAIAQRNNLSFQGVVPPNRGSPNYVRPDSGSAFIAVNVVLAAAALLTVLLRFYARLYVAGSVGTDDITIGIAMAIVSGSTALNCWGTYSLPSSLQTESKVPKFQQFN